MFLRCLVFDIFSARLRFLVDFENYKGDNMFEDSDARATNYYFVTICSHFRDTMRKIQNKLVDIFLLQKSSVFLMEGTITLCMISMIRKNKSTF